MMAQPGDVVLVRFPFTDLSTSKVRPAAVLATHGDDLIIVGIFSSLAQPTRNTWVLVSDVDPAFPQTGLKAPGLIKGERIAVVERSVAVKLALNLA